MAAEFPEITYRAPILLEGSASALRPEIRMQWTVDVELTQFQNPSSLASLVQLYNESTNESVPLEYVEYLTGTRVLVLRPTQDLPRSTLFTVFLDKLVLSTTGRKSKIAFRWQFETSAGGIGVAQILGPADLSVQTELPVFSWTPPTTGTVNYILQVDDRWDFSSVIYQATTQASSFIPALALTEGQTYYWRVSAYTSTATGAWSSIYQFYYGTARQHTDDTSRQTWYQSESFGVQSAGWDGLQTTHLSAWPTLSITFYSTPESGYATKVFVKQRAQMPRNDQTSQYQETDVAGSWSLSGNTLTFTPSAPPSSNTRYEIRILSTLENEDGTALGQDLMYSFSGMYDPYYADARAIRSRFLSAEHHIPDDLINFYIYQVSLEANARYYMYLQGQPIPFGNQPAESLVRDSQKLNSYGVGRWVEATVTYRVLKGVLFESLRLVDSERKLGDYSFKLGPGFLKAIEMAMQTAKEEMDYWEDYLTVSDIPRATSRSAHWSPHNRDWDWSIMDLEARRDNLF